jgi:hypothetical protein
MIGDVGALGHEVQYFARWEADPRLRASAASDEFWRGLCPGLTITDRPFQPPGAPFEFDGETTGGAVACVRRDGYLTTGPVLEQGTCNLLADAVLRVVDAGYHPLFLAVYDEFWRPWTRLANLLRPVLTAAPQLIGDFWIWCVSPRHAPSGWRMHRDLGTAEAVTPEGVPNLLTVWLPYTDATPENGCIRVLPASRDPQLNVGWRGPEPDLDPGEGGDPHLLPARAGSLVAWHPNLLHGGGACAPDAAPRISAGIYFRGEGRSKFSTHLPFDAPLPFARRLYLIAAAMLRYQKIFQFPREALRFVGDHALPPPPRSFPPA